MTRKNHRWTEKEIAMIKELYPKIGGKALAERMGVPHSQLKGKARHIGIKEREEIWTNTRLQELKDRYEVDGPAILAREWNESRYAIVAKAKRLGLGSRRKIPPKDFEWTEEMLQAIRDRYAKEGGRKLAMEFGISRFTLGKKANSLGLKTKALLVADRKKRAENSSSLDVHYFDKWSPNMAYILGFMFADGSVNKKLTNIVINLQRPDQCVLEFIKKEMKLEPRIYQYDGKGEKRKPFSTICISSTVLVKQAIKLGLKPRKTFNNYEFPEIPDDMMPHFLRGVFDGDGTTSVFRGNRCAVSFVGPPLFIQALRKHMVEKVGLSFVTIQNRKGKTSEYSYVAWTSDSDIQSFAKYIYPDGFEFCLERKKKIIDNWISRPRGKRRQSRKWTKEEEDVVRNSCQSLGCLKVAEMINRSEFSVYRKSKELGVI